MFRLAAVILLIGLIIMMYFKFSADDQLHTTSEMADTHATLKNYQEDTLTELQRELSLTATQQNSSTVEWYGLKETTELSGTEILFNVNTVEETVTFEDQIKGFFAKRGFREDLNQAAGGPSGYQSGYVSIESARRCLVNHSADYDRGEDGDVFWKSASYSVFCENKR
ncbi:hypothetical protein N9L26_00395 [Candidatus Pacebacteria bacterium]|nr:hypothetical protein [Candidatus Paceibacterota bacterium]